MIALKITPQGDALYIDINPTTEVLTKELKGYPRVESPFVDEESVMITNSEPDSELPANKHITFAKVRGNAIFLSRAEGRYYFYDVKEATVESILRRCKLTITTLEERENLWTVAIRCLRALYKKIFRF